MSNETLWQLIERVPHEFAWSAKAGSIMSPECPRCKLEAWAREKAAEWPGNTTKHGATTDLGVPPAEG